MEFAKSRGFPPQVLEWCNTTVKTETLRVKLGGELFELTPSINEQCTWKSEHLCSSPLVDLKGLTAEEATGQRITVWYTEMIDEVEKDVPYFGTVMDAHARGGLLVQFDYAKDEDGKPEELLIGDEDDWLFGLNDLKPVKG